ncbi:thymidylate synthase ThyX [Clostridium sp. C2-6-12]|uniref:thymidylate synthase ThyX n=1 Tax=Clostridium sp. C2-6-12 TaxID=2698832 RepID=UPI00137211D3|nr:thymidylate synthase ThyX [Clostridium sp. C2-6-12]
MKVKFLGKRGSWRDVADSARTTINKEAGEKEPSSNWKRRMLLCEHSPIRQLFIKCKWYELKSWVSVHFVRHKFGIEHWVRTQREDRTGINRDELPQGSFVEHEFIATTQAMINISRKRLCNQASEETRNAWKEVLNSIKDEEPELYNVCVPDCIYRGWCYEFKSCGYHKTEAFKERLRIYRDDINK